MVATDTRPAFEDDARTADDRAAIDRALAELLTGLDVEVRGLIAAGRVAEAIGVEKFNAFEQQHPFAQRDQVARIRGA